MGLIAVQHTSSLEFCVHKIGSTVYLCQHIGYVSNMLLALTFKVCGQLFLSDRQRIFCVSLDMIAYSRKKSLSELVYEFFHALSTVVWVLLGSINNNRKFSAQPFQI